MNPLKLADGQRVVYLWALRNLSKWRLANTAESKDPIREHYNGIAAKEYLEQLAASEAAKLSKKRAFDASASPTVAARD
jgi:hypothetical protein